MTRIEREKHTVSVMVGMYCKAHHATAAKASADEAFCPECKALVDYALARLDHCRFADQKPSCRKCPVHCYKPDMRQAMREVMRYTGPRMMLRHPILALRHMLNR